MVVVRVSEGLLKGEIVKSVLGREYCSFKGIPYARPPVGDLRFKAPQPPQPWDGIKNATEYGPTCHQFDMFTSAIKPGSEDCLYLNVYTPSLKSSSPLPVMVWIHGGGFMSGSGNDDMYGPDFLIEKDVIIVTFNYRLEVIGFLCLDTPDVPGNAGMKDQVAALRWVQKNIKQFGGDPDNVTIFGESAGGASVSYHLVSPMSKGLFKRAIIQSGTMNCYWAQSFEPREKGLALAHRLGYKGRNDQDLYDFFKKIPVESLVATRDPVTMNEALTKDVVLFLSIVNEKQFGNNERFFYGNVYDRLREGIHENVEVMIGYTADEGVLNLAFMEKDDIENTLNRFLESFVPPMIYRNCKVSDQLQVGRSMKNHYFGASKVDPGNAAKMLDYYSMNMFVFDTIQWTKFHTKRKGNKAYLYKFTCHSERNIVSKVFNTSKFASIERPLTAHGDDLGYLFNAKMMDLPLEQQSKSFSMIQNVTKLWTNFAKFGNPTPDNSLDVKWEPYTLEQEDYLEIGEKLKARKSADKEDISFWESIFAQYVPQVLP